jgi:hypothetical protein
LHQPIPQNIRCTEFQRLSPVARSPLDSSSQSISELPTNGTLSSFDYKTETLFY